MEASYHLVVSLAQQKAFAILAIVGATLDKGFGRMIRNIVDVKFTPVESALLSIVMASSGKLLANVDHFAVSGFGVLTMALSLVIFQQAVKNWQLGKCSKIKAIEPALPK